MNDESGSLQMNLLDALELRACMRLAGDNRIDTLNESVTVLQHVNQNDV